MPKTITWEIADPWEPLGEPAHSIHAAWRKWRIESCIERHRQHIWVLFVENHDEEESIELYCEGCPVEVDDVFATDYIDLLYGDLGELKIEQGRPNITGEYHIPVYVDFHVKKYTSMNSIGPEYALWINLTLRGTPGEPPEVPGIYSVDQRL